jgi:predicted nucleic acid-binding protein
LSYEFFLLGTNVVSEWFRPQPDRKVISWLSDVDEDRAFIRVIAFAEIRRGLEMLPTGRRRDRLVTWLAEELPARFEKRILDIDPQVAETWGVVMARGQKIGLTLGSVDAFVAATAEVHALTSPPATSRTSRAQVFPCLTRGSRINIGADLPLSHIPRTRGGAGELACEHTPGGLIDRRRWMNHRRRRQYRRVGETVDAVCTHCGRNELSRLEHCQGNAQARQRDG